MVSCSADSRGSPTFHRRTIKNRRQKARSRSGPLQWGGGELTGSWAEEEDGGRNLISELPAVSGKPGCFSISLSLYADRKRSPGHCREAACQYSPAGDLQAKIPRSSLAPFGAVCAGVMWELMGEELAWTRRLKEGEHEAWVEEEEMGYEFHIARSDLAQASSLERRHGIQWDDHTFLRQWKGDG
eukprot:765482-Hanusia_phi.AAC.3